MKFYPLEKSLVLSLGDLTPVVIPFECLVVDGERTFGFDTVVEEAQRAINFGTLR